MTIFSELSMGALFTFDNIGYRKTTEQSAQLLAGHVDAGKFQGFQSMQKVARRTESPSSRISNENLIIAKLAALNYTCIVIDTTERDGAFVLAKKDMLSSSFTTWRVMVENGEVELWAGNYDLTYEGAIFNFNIRTGKGRRFSEA